MLNIERTPNIIISGNVLEKKIQLATLRLFLPEGRRIMARMVPGLFFPLTAET